MGWGFTLKRYLICYYLLSPEQVKENTHTSQGYSSGGSVERSTEISATRSAPSRRSTYASHVGVARMKKKRGACAMGMVRACKHRYGAGGGPKTSFKILRICLFIRCSFVAPGNDVYGRCAVCQMSRLSRCTVAPPRLPWPSSVPCPGASLLCGVKNNKLYCGHITALRFLN